MPHIPHWIEAQLSTRFEGLNLNVGVDFDGSGAIDGSELTDTNNDGTVDAEEWRAFLNQNESALRNFGGFFNYYFDYGTAFKPDNILHDLLFIESVFADEAQIAGAYQMVWNVLERVRSTPRYYVMPLFSSYDVMREMGIVFANHENDLFIQDVTDRLFDCDTASDVLLAIAHELNIPASMVYAPEHFFIRYIDDGVRLNVDIGGASHTDLDYAIALNISPQSIAEGIYLDELSYDELLALYYRNVAITYRKNKNDVEALRYYNISAGFNENDPATYNNRGIVKEHLDDYKGALEDFNRALVLDPNSGPAYYSRGWLRSDLGDCAGALSDMERAAELMPNSEDLPMALLEIKMLYWNSQDMGGGPF